MTARLCLRAALALIGESPERADLPLAARSPRDAELAHVCRALASEAHAARLDGWVLLALAWRESRLEPARVNPTSGAAGVLQVIPRWAPPRFAGRDLTRIDVGAAAGAELLAAWVRRCGDLALGLGGYMGHGCKSTRGARSVLRLGRAMALRWRRET